VRFLRQAFLGGLVVLLPTVVTLWVFWKLFIGLDQLLAPLIERLLPFPVPGVGFVSVLLIILVAGFFAGSLLGRQMTSIYKRLILRLPLIGKVFNAVDRLLSVVQEQTAYKGVVCFQYPREGSWSLGFVTNRSLPRIHGLVDEDGRPRDMLHIFLPTTPNPTSGYFLLVPADEVLHPDLTVEEALNIIISGGAILPEELPGLPPEGEG